MLHNSRAQMLPHCWGKDKGVTFATDTSPLTSKEKLQAFPPAVSSVQSLLQKEKLVLSISTHVPEQLCRSTCELNGGLVILSYRPIFVLTTYSQYRVRVFYPRGKRPLIKSWCHLTKHIKKTMNYHAQA